MVKPEYCKNVIVGVIYKKKFAWYITKKDIMNICKLIASEGYNYAYLIDPTEVLNVLS